MSKEKPARYIIFGAGAVGTAVGGLLLKAGCRVAFVARPAYAEALQQGVTIHQGEAEIVFTADAVTSANQLTITPDDVVVIATKSQVMESVVEELAALCADNTPVVCLQNGVRNEGVAARRFSRVYAGLLMMSAVQIEPRRVTMPIGRHIAIGLYPDGVDERARQMCEDLRRAGFDALASPYTMAMKWGKLIANLNNATHTITNYWLELGLADPDMRQLMLAVREEGLRVLDAAGIACEPPEGEPSFVRIRDWTERIRNAKGSRDEAERIPAAARTYASMWQDLFLGRRTHEGDHLNGEIIAIGKQAGVPTPYNSTLLEVVDRMFAEGRKPGLYTPAALHDFIRKRAASGDKQQFQG